MFRSVLVGLHDGLFHAQRLLFFPRPEAERLRDRQRLRYGPRGDLVALAQLDPPLASVVAFVQGDQAEPVAPVEFGATSAIPDALSSVAKISLTLSSFTASAISDSFTAG